MLSVLLAALVGTMNLGHVSSMQVRCTTLHCPHRAFAISKPDQGTEITSLAFSGDGNTLASRGVDGTLKIWDLRR